MLKVNNFLSVYEYIPKPAEITDEEIQEKIKEAYLRFQPSVSFNNVDWDDYETLMGIITGCYRWSDLDLIETIFEYGSELLRRKIKDLIKAY
jgi:hypothetical protein